MVETRPFHSKSNPGRPPYQLRFNRATGEIIWCDCPAYRNANGDWPRTCPHERQVRAEFGASSNELTVVRQSEWAHAKRYHLSNGWFIDGATKTCGKHFNYKYSLWEPGGDRSGGAAWRAGSDTLKGILGEARRVLGTPAPQAHTAPSAPTAAARLRPMLASAMVAGATVADFMTADWRMEEKFDGHRVLVRKAGALWSAWSRPRAGSEPLARELPPALWRALADLPDGVYDGELIVPGGMSSDVTRLDQRDALRLVLFDVVEVLGASVTSKPYGERRALLEVAVAHHTGGLILLPPSVPVTREAVQAIWDRGGEGAILKRLSSTYRPGFRSPDWVKVKKTAADVLTVTGFQAGKLGPFSVAQLRADDGRETTVKVKDLATMRAIAANPSAFIGRRLVLAYIQKTGSGSYRHGVWDHLLDETTTSPVTSRPAARGKRSAAAGSSALHGPTVPAPSLPSPAPSDAPTGAPPASQDPSKPPRKPVDWAAAGRKAWETRKARLAEAARRAS